MTAAYQSQHYDITTIMEADDVMSSPAELVSHLVQVISSPAQLCFHVMPAAVKLRLHGLHPVVGERQAALQVLILLLEDSVLRRKGQRSQRAEQHTE